ncbi:MAG: hypothetical protein RLZZ453_1169 [Chlamydiota bacterium]|jgi:23S rRNA (cytosine1962-C5)-methyltransferase
MNKYALLDTGYQKKLEKFGDVTLVRPCSAALWKPVLPDAEWRKADAMFSRDGKEGWIARHPLPKNWVVELEGLSFKLSSTDFGHVGVFPEHSLLWKPMQEALQKRKNPSVLNLFAYSGGATLAAAKAGAKVCHVDASKGMVAWARENAELNDLSSAPIRWIIDDVFKFLKREVKRGVRYDAILLDPPSFGRGTKQEVFKIEKDIHPLLDLCIELLSDTPLFLLLTTHTPGMTGAVLQQLLSQKLKGSVTGGELLLPSTSSQLLPSGHFAKWSPC